MRNFNLFSKKRTSLLTCLLFFSTLFCGIPFDVPSAQASLLSEKSYSTILPGPTPPVAPNAPSKPLLNEKKENKAAPKEQEPQKKPIPAAKPQPEKTPEKALEQVPKSTEKQQPPSSRLQKGEEGESTSKSIAETPKDKKALEIEEKSALPLLEIAPYFVLFFLIGASTLYVYGQYCSPKEPIKKQKKLSPQPRQTAPPVELEIAAKIKNKSLLEELVKYDMETYGELRPTLNYDHPLYVEQLIVKYGHGNKEKIHRAIELYNQRRSPK